MKKDIIHIEDLTEKDIGRSVTYIPYKSCDPSLYEHGHITSYNENYVFVDYGDNCGRGKATKFCDLRFNS